LRLFKNAWFERFARREKITDKVLKNAISRAEQGMIDANLGGYVIKQRIARQGQGKSGGYGQSLFLKKEKTIFLFMDLQKVNGAISTRQKERLSKILQKNYWPCLTSK